ncbi:hypothetical protein CMI37_15655 [Candidatus Pacearchaeota archaeon]|nr:hypothetical protein [Candidatus Pacearchaeota archaeon]
MELSEFFAKRDNAPPRGAKRMQVRSRMSYSRGYYQLELESSCGSRNVTVGGRPRISNNIKGAMKLSLYDIRDESGKPSMVKRMQVDSWREAQEEFYTAKELLR